MTGFKHQQYLKTVTTNKRLSVEYLWFADFIKINKTNVDRHCHTNSLLKNSAHIPYTLSRWLLSVGMMC